MRSGERIGCCSSTDGAAADEGVSHLRESAALLSFGSFRLDLEQRRLLCVTNEGEQSVALGSRAFDLLLLLASRPGALISKDELVDAAWPGVTVEENNLSVQISALRRALGDGQNGTRLIETVPGRGYRFLAAVTKHARPAPDPPSSRRTRRPQLSRHRAAPIRLGLACSGCAGGACGCRLPACSSPIEPGAPAKPVARPALSIVVLPFTAGGADRAYDYVAEAITDDLTDQDHSDRRHLRHRAWNGQRLPRPNRQPEHRRPIRRALPARRQRPPARRAHARERPAGGGGTAGPRSGRISSTARSSACPRRRTMPSTASPRLLGSRLVDTEARRVAREHPTDRPQWT